MTTFHDFKHADIDGHDVSLDRYKGKVLLVVNVASRCGLTPQYTGLEELYRAYRERCFEVLGYPCNQFAGQEPGSEADIKTFCSTQYDVTFPLFRKLDVNGADAHPLYAWLTAQDVQPEGAGPIKWNFGKFLIGKDGTIVARHKPTTAPSAEALVADVERALGA